MYYWDTEAISYDWEAGAFADGVEELFVEDGIHLTPASRIVWAEKWILPMLEELEVPRKEEGVWHYYQDKI